MNNVEKLLNISEVSRVLTGGKNRRCISSKNVPKKYRSSYMNLLGAIKRELLRQGLIESDNLQVHTPKNQNRQPG